MKKILITFLAVCNLYLVQSQDSWTSLSLVTFESTFDEDFGMEMLTPSYSPIVMAMDGTEIEVEGYFIALDGKKKQNHFMLSKFPQSTCFFCGKAGPESAIQVFLADNKMQEYSDEKIKVKGILRVNTTDPTGLLYTLEGAVSLD